MCYLVYDYNISTKVWNTISKKRWKNETEKTPLEKDGSLHIHETLKVDDVYIIDYSIRNKTYSVHTTTHFEHNDLLRQYVHSYDPKKLLREIIFAELHGTYGKENVTNILTKAQGLKCDFHREILDKPITWDHILYEYDLDSWETLTIVDSFGQVHSISMSSDCTIEWKPEFILY